MCLPASQPTHLWHGSGAIIRCLLPRQYSRGIWWSLVSHYLLTCKQDIMFITVFSVALLVICTGSRTRSSVFHKKLWLPTLTSLCLFSQHAQHQTFSVFSLLREWDVILIFPLLKNSHQSHTKLRDGVNSVLLTLKLNPFTYMKAKEIAK